MLRARILTHESRQRKNPIHQNWQNCIYYFESEKIEYRILLRFCVVTLRARILTHEARQCKNPIHLN